MVVNYCLYNYTFNFKINAADAQINLRICGKNKLLSCGS
jgi:hypothetical protein